MIIICNVFSIKFSFKAVKFDASVVVDIISQSNVLLAVTLLQDMWLGVLHHVVGEHEWHDRQCSHGPLASPESDKPILEKGSKAMEALRKVIYDKRWLESLIFYVWFK